ncbi:MAG: hypothetical protein GY801_07015 [bacterium]|nr:hypothetical protein [bacterium]
MSEEYSNYMAYGLRIASELGALLHQRELLPLHGSAIKVNDGVCVFVGLSGNGKSTVAAAFRQRGYQVLADDVCVVSIREDGLPPGDPRVSAVEALG